MWTAAVALSAADAAAGWSWLDAAEAERARSSSHQGPRSPRDRFVGARTRLRQIVAGYLDRPPAAIRVVPGDCPCGEVGRGRPVLVDGGGLQVSISHAGSFVAVALAWNAPLGVDIEQDAVHRPVDGPRLAARFFAPGEQEMVAAEPATFAQLWARKEAVGKALGTGIAHGGLARDVRTERVATGPGMAVVGVADVAVAGGYRGAVASPALPGTVVCDSY